MAITFKDILGTSNLTNFTTPITVANIIASLSISFITGMFIFYVYKKTYSGVLYSKNFNVTLIMATMVSSMVIMAISGNLALSLGMVGALSIIRFRTAVKDPKDVTFLFWAVGVGIVNGIQFYKLSILSSILIGLVLFILSKNAFRENPYILILKYSDADQKELESVLKKHCKKFETRNVIIDEATMHEKTIEVKIEEKNINQLLKEIKEIKGVSKAMMFSHTGELSE